MLKFWRKIRRKLLTEGNLKRYSVYAIGEILLVMVGILLALQVNNWNENRKNQSRVRSHLIEIKSELEYDLTEIEQIITEQETAYKATFLLHKFVNQNININDTQKLGLALFEAGFLAIFNNSKGAYNNFINSGDIQFIKDDLLKRSLISFHNEEDWSKSYIDGPMIKSYERYLEYIHKVSKPGLIPNYYIHEFMEKYELSTTVKESYVNPNTLTVDLNLIKSDQNFSAIIDQVHANRVIQNQTYHEWKIQMEELIFQIEKYLSST